MTTNDKIDLFKKLKKTEYSQPKTPKLIEVKKGMYLTIQGSGAPGGEEFEKRVGALYSTAYTIKMTRKYDNKQDYVIGKLECQLWSAQGQELKNTPKDQWQWKLLIRTPEIVKAAELKQTVSTQAKKGKNPFLAEVKLESITEGKCVQMLHIGPYDREGETVEKMQSFAQEQGYVFHGRHHDIYLSDPRRIPPERLKTILRMPVRKA